MSLKKTEVQGLALALFGVYAGGFLETLTREGGKLGLGGLSNALVGLQPTLAGRSLAQDGDWADYILGNLGLNSADPLYVTAKVVVLVQLGMGQSRGDVVAALVNFLGAVAAGDLIAPPVSALADKFFGFVVKGVRWSESVDSGAAVTELQALRAAAVADGASSLSGNANNGTTPAPVTPEMPDPAKPVTPVQPKPVLSPLGDLLEPYKAAVQALRAFDIQGDAALSNAIEAAEIKADAALKDSLLDSFFQYNVDESASGQTAAADQAERAAGKAAELRWQTTLETYRQFKQVAENALRSLDAGAPALVDQYATVLTKFQSASLTLSDAETALSFEVSKPNTTFADGYLFYDLASDSHTVTVSFWKNGDTEVLGSNAAGAAWVDGPSAKTVSSTVQGLAAALARASSAYAKAEADVLGALNTLETRNGAMTDATEIGEINAFTSLEGAALDYLSGVLALGDLNYYINIAKAALAVVDQTRSSATAARNVLEADVQTTVNALVSRGYTLTTLTPNARQTGDDKGNLYDVSPLAGGANNAELLQFGTQGLDALIVNGYRQASTATGIDSLLEYRVQTAGNDTVIVFESVPGGFNSSTGGAESEFTVVLVGKSTSTLTYEDGLILG